MELFCRMKVLKTEIMRVFILSLILFFGFSVLRGQVKYDTAYLNSGYLHIDSEDIPLALFTESSRFDTVDRVFHASPGETLHLTLHNLLDFDVEVGCDLISETVIIPAGGNNSLTIATQDPGGYGVYAQNDELKYYGLSTVLMVAKENEHRYIWNLRAFDKEANRRISEGGTPDFDAFTPLIFTLNTEAFHVNQMNLRGMVNGNVNDSMYITFAGSNIMHHAPHFHGYHVEIIHSNMENHMIGWSKDSFPLRRDEIITVLLVPHQPGKFPVHDHNLVSSTTNGNYPGGIMGMLHIMP